MAGFFGDNMENVTHPPVSAGDVNASGNSRVLVGSVFYDNDQEGQDLDLTSKDDVSSISTSMESLPALTAKILDAASFIYSHLRQYQNQARRLKCWNAAVVTLSILLTHCGTVRDKLSTVMQSMLEVGDQKIEDRFDGFLLERYRDILIAFHAVFSLVRQHLGMSELCSGESFGEAALQTKLRKITSLSRSIPSNIEGLVHTVSGMIPDFKCPKNAELETDIETEEEFASYSRDVDSQTLPLSHPGLYPRDFTLEMDLEGPRADKSPMFDHDETLNNTRAHCQAQTNTSSPKQHQDSQEVITSDASCASRVETENEVLYGSDNKATERHKYYVRQGKPEMAHIVKTLLNPEPDPEKDYVPIMTAAIGL